VTAGCYRVPEPPTCHDGDVPAQSDRNVASPADPGREPPGPSPAGSLTVLGQTVRHAIEHVECFPAPERVRSVRFSTDEVGSVCPVTGQPDLSRVVIEYEPAQRCVESKSLKLYLWSFRDRAVFAEAMAAEIASEIMGTAQPRSVSVTLTQRPRGGIQIEAVATLP